MKRRDFIRTGICLGCAGALGTGAMLCKKEGLSNLSDIKTFLAERKFLYKSVDELPKKIKIDLCNLCQLNCPECFLRKNEEIIKRDFAGFGYVSFETFKNFVDAHPFIEEIEIAHNGEVLLNPELEDIVRYAHEKGIQLTALIGVNLNTLSERMAEALVKYKFKVFSVSIDAATPETYPIYRRNGNFNDVIHNIKTINKYKEKYNSPFPYMIYNFILFGHNVHEIKKAKELSKELGMMMTMFQINHSPEYSPLNPKDTEWILKETGLKTLKPIPEMRIKDYLDGKYMFGFCTDLYQFPQVNFDGELFGCSMCALAYNKTFGINVFKEGLLNAMNNEKVLYTKLMLYDNSVKPREDSPCTKCGMFDIITKNNVCVKDPKSFLKI